MKKLYEIFKVLKAKKRMQWVSLVDVGGLAPRCSLWFVFASVFLPAPQRKASQKKLMQIAHYRDPNRVT
jgi:hypothetical protein